MADCSLCMLLLLDLSITFNRYLIDEDTVKQLLCLVNSGWLILVYK